MGRHARWWLVGIVLLVAAAVEATRAAPPTIGVELNKLESAQGACRAYLVFENSTDQSYTSFELDLVLFDREGRIGKRVALEVAPLRAHKTTVKVFDIQGMGCEAVGRVLINEVLQCEAPGGAVGDCVQRLEPTSRADAALIK